ncbi:MAG: homocysteine S-methyltransferase family protein [Candidatus Omnitrophica bacterium]|nr:homocysteine S-methyltransferase family protein [Candidatus Omnitrophota bacterium]
MSTLQRILGKKIIFLDGATGTELQKKGMPQGVCPEKWCLDNPDIISGVHRDYIRSGANLVYSCTFGANQYKLEEYGIKDVRSVNRDLVRIAKHAVGPHGLVAGDVGPTGKFIEPFGPLLFEDAVNAFKEQIRGLLEGGADLIVIETMIDIQEARAALIAARELTDKPVFVTMTFEKDGRTLNGTDPVTALITLQSLGADAVGCNCSAGPKEMIPFIRSMYKYAKIPLIAKPNAGMPKLKDGKTVFDMKSAFFAAEGKKLILAGASIVGGCCGTTPVHIQALYQKTKTSKVRKPLLKSLSAVSSARKHLFLQKHSRALVIGECINPTGRKLFQKELFDGKMSLVRQFAREQEVAGADLLDVNVGAPGVVEEKIIQKALNILSVSTGSPLVVDSSKVEAVEKALRIYPGRAMINSISGEKEKLEKLLPIASKYGAMFILLPVAKSVPKTFKERKIIIQNVFEKAKKYGFTKQDFVVDGLVMSVSSLANAGVETIKTVDWCANTFKVNTVVGLSNVSFGMPCRSIINSTFLSMLEKRGLSTVIANPMRLKRQFSKLAEKLLLGKDKDAVRFISHYSKQKVLPKKTEKGATLEQKVYRAILEGNREEIKGLVSDLCKTGFAEQDVVHNIMIPAINQVGEFFDKKQYFLPQLVASAEAMKVAFEFIEPKLKKKKIKTEKKNVIILATVKGDIHDIGKNIVSLLLKNHGFEVIDLGKDVSADRIVNEIKKHKSPVVGLSALMTTTMVNMKDVIQKADQQNIKCRFMVGGAVITKAYAQSLGAEYSQDGVEAVRVAKELSKS